MIALQIQGFNHFTPFFGLFGRDQVGSAEMAGIIQPSWNCSVALSVQGASENSDKKGDGC